MPETERYVLYCFCLMPGTTPYRDMKLGSKTQRLALLLGIAAISCGAWEAGRDEAAQSLLVMEATPKGDTQCQYIVRMKYE